MPKRVRIQGVIYNVPDNATMDQIQEYVASKGVKPTAPPPDNADILAEQAARYPTSAEQGGRPGAAVENTRLQGFAEEGRRNTAALSQSITTGLESTPEHPLNKLELPSGVLAASPSNLVTKGASGLEMLYGGGQFAKAGAGTILRGSPVVSTAIAAEKALTGTAREMMSFPRDPIRAMTKAFKPTATNMGWEDALGRALPELNAVQTASGKPIETIEDVQAAAKAAKQSIWGQYEQVLGPQAQRGIDGTPVADAIERSISAKVRHQDPAAAKKLSALADTYRRTFTIQELDDFLTTSNAELAAYYGKYPAARNVATAGNPEIAQNVAEADSLRDTIYKALDAPGGGEPARELKRRYGALMNVEKESQRRLNVVRRQNPDSLSEQLSKWQAAMKVGKAIVTAPVRPWGAAGDLAEAYAGRKAASLVKEANTSDFLIKNVFQNYKGLPKPINMVQWQPSGLLGPAPKFLNETNPLHPDDISGVFGVKAAPAKRTLRLPEQAGGPHITPPPKESLLEQARRFSRRK